MAAKKPAPPSTGELLEAVSNLVVRVSADRVGRGPTKARAYTDRDIIVCVMEDTMTTAERTLVDSGQSTAVKQSREALQETMRDDLATGIEALTGRRVIAQIGNGTFDPDVTSDLFILDGQGPTSTNGGNGRGAAGHPRPTGRNRPRVV
jgi:uncharacterized protein YbcI